MKSPLSGLAKTRGSRVMGLDCSTRSVGYCLVDSGRPILWGEIFFEGHNTFYRLSQAQSTFRALIDDSNIKYDTVVFESAVLVHSQKTLILLAYAFGAIVSSIIKSDTRIEELTPVAWQSAIGNKNFTPAEKAQLKKDYPGKGSGWYTDKVREIRKARTIDWVKSTHGITVDSDNVADAIAIASVGYNKFYGPNT